METFLYESFLELVRTLDCSFPTPLNETRVNCKLVFTALSACMEFKWDCSGILIISREDVERYTLISKFNSC